MNENINYEQSLLEFSQDIRRRIDANKRELSNYGIEKACKRLEKIQKKHQPYEMTNILIGIAIQVLQEEIKEA